MSECEVPNWNLRHQRQEQVEVEGNRSSHWHTQQPNSLFPMPNYEVAELTWENGQLAMHRLGELVPTAQTKRSWALDGDTLESIIHQGTHNKQNLNFVEFNEFPTMIDSVASSGGKWAEDMSENRMGLRSKKKCSRAESGPCQRQYSNTVQEEGAGTGAGASASASATFFRDTDTTMMTWTSLESLPSFKTKTTEEDSACRGGLENQDEEPETKGETGRSLSTRRSRAATVHNQSERRRRDRINQKMRALQKLVPNSSKTDKASMLDEVIEYLKQLQAQVQVMNIRNMNMNMNMPQMMMPIGMQQQLQMSLLARMGMGMGLGMGMGMFDMNSIARTASQPVSPLLHPTSVAAAATPTFVPPPFVVPPMMASHTTSPMTSDLTSNDPRCTFLAQQQSMNMDLYNKMAAIYQQQVNQTAQATSISSQANHVERV